MRGPGFLYKPHFWIEVIYSLIIVVSCLIIYFKTKKMHKLTSHRGIKYFSNTFLFFAIAYFFRFFFRIFFILFMITSGIFFPRRFGFNIGLAVFIFASTMSALFLLYSVTWKKIDRKKDHTLFLLIIALMITVVDYYLRNPLIHIITLTILFSAAAVGSIIYRSKSKKKQGLSGIYVIYILIFLFWILNVISLEIPRFMFELNIAISTISVLLFLVILWRVHKRTSVKR